MSGTPANLKVNILADVDKAVQGINSVGDSLDNTSRSASKADSAVKESGRNLDDLGEHAGTAASTASQAAGAFGDLGTGLQNVGGPIGAVGSGMQLLQLPIMAVAGASDLAEVAMSKLGITNLKTAASTVASKTAQLAAAAATKVMTAAQWLLNAALDASPVLLIAVGIAALVAGIVYLATQTQFFQNLWAAVWGAVQGAISAVVDWIKSNWPLLVEILTGPIGIAVIQIIKHWDSIKNGFSAVKDWIGQKIDDIVSFFTSLPGRIAGVVKGAFDSVSNEATSSVKGALNGMIGLLNKGIGFINSKLIDTANDIPFVNIPHIPNIPALATGGTVWGPGTGTSDSIFARISSGETVIDRRTSDALRNLLIGTGHGSLAGDVNLDAHHTINVQIGNDQINDHITSIVDTKINRTATRAKAGVR